MMNSKTEGSTLVYSKGNVPQPRRWLVALLICVVFAASDFGSEYFNQQLFLRRLISSTNPSPRKLQALEDKFDSDLLVESFYTFWATLILFCGFFLASQRHMGISEMRGAVMAFGAGVAYCESRWIIWFICKPLPFDYSELIDWIIATCLAVSMTAIFMRWLYASRIEVPAIKSTKQSK